MTEREFWFSQSWSARKRPDGTLEPDRPIGGVWIGPSEENPYQMAAMVRAASASLGVSGADGPFFIVQGRFVPVFHDDGVAITAGHQK